MSFVRLVLLCSCACLFARVAEAQALTAELDAAEAKLRTKDWDAAVDLLLGMVPEHGSTGERERLATQLTEAANALRDSKPSHALRAYERALAVLILIHGSEDHEDLVTSRNDLGYCLLGSGRAREALSYNEAALHVARRLAGNGNHVAVASSLTVRVYCLTALGQSAAALEHAEEALATYVQLHSNRDHRDVATSLGNVASCLKNLGRLEESLRQYEAALAMQARLFAGNDHLDVAWSLDSAANCLLSLGRATEALPQHERALAMYRRLYGAIDHPSIAGSLNNVGTSLEAMGRVAAALPQFEASLEMELRLHGDRDNPSVAMSLANVASCLQSLGRPDEALLVYERALAMRERLFEGRDHPAVATSLNGLATCLNALGRSGEALPASQRALAMRQRLHGDRDHPDVASSMGNVAHLLASTGRDSEALPLFEQALSMSRRLFADRDHPSVALHLNDLARCLDSLGRADEALPRFEEALAMRSRLHAGGDHQSLVASSSDLAHCLQSLGRTSEAVTQFEATLAMTERLSAQRPHPDVATLLNNLADCLQSMNRADEARTRAEAALAIYEVLFGDRPHPNVATSLNNLGHSLRGLGRDADALRQYERALGMRSLLFGHGDHPDLVKSLTNVAACLGSLGQTTDALATCEKACAMSERLRERCSTSPELRQSYFDMLKHGGAFEQLQALAARAGHEADAFFAAERSRGRELLDVIELQRFDPLAAAERIAREDGDQLAATRMQALRGEITTVSLESDRLLHLVTRLDAGSLGESEQADRRAALVAQSKSVNDRLRQLLDERARLLGDLLPIGRLRSVEQIGAALRHGEVLLEFTVTKEVSLLHVLTRDGQVDCLPLPAAFTTAERAMPLVMASGSRSAWAPQRGRNPGAAASQDSVVASSRELFASLIPASLWQRIKGSDRVFIAAHRALHRLPFEILVTDVTDGKPIYWLDCGPAVSYVPSGSALAWLRDRPSEGAERASEPTLLAIGDPASPAPDAVAPDHGAFVTAVQPDGQAARIGLQPRDVLLSFDGKLISSQAEFGGLRRETEAAIADGTRPDSAIAVEVWRAGATMRFEVQKGPLGVQIAVAEPRLAYEGSFDNETRTARILRKGDIERIQKLPRLHGAQAEAKAITAVWAAENRAARALLGVEATESAVFDLAATADYLHFACHGIAEEYAGQSLSMLVLNQTQPMQPESDGLLKLGDLLHRWHGRLSGCRLVVLSACRTNVGPTLRDEAPQALPIGFLFAGASSVISSLWAVDDDSTRVLMTDFYTRLAAGETDRLKAFAEAKKALRQQYPDPFYWAPFQFLGTPD